MSLDDLPDRIKEHIIAATNSDYTRRDNSLHVTELVYCLRKAYYRRMAEKEGEKEEKGIKQRWYLYRGIVFDEAWTGLFARNQVRVTHRVRNGPTIVGRIDFIDDDGTLYELKTISNDYAIRDGPKPAHVKQALFYAWIEQAPRVRLVYVHLGGVHIFELDTRLAEQVVEEVEQKAIELWRALKEGRPPEPHNEPWECRYCEFRDLCAIEDLS
ncbi:MAG: PD-(D/E)XK nuclease family protein [Archaeoglobus sp.]|uniref:PD-(D/E)XK nuclease family protein n=1 Tax=Archaeoglobus sp. TaxID=1872626 RepID=UPI001E10192F|nr:PD-(D/E)XK nuclease family protein [Archaeoglobus sp.]MBO8181028.1 PD-(D/E)XK nuclease family protein [Archaeoglobus sp.]